jgi:hypothetical protein
MEYSILSRYLSMLCIYDVRYLAKYVQYTLRRERVRKRWKQQTVQWGDRNVIDTSLASNAFAIILRE